MAGSGGRTGSGGAVDGGVKQAGGRQLLRGGMGGAAGRPWSSPAVGGGSGGVTGTGGDRKMCRFIGTGRGAGRGTGTGGGAWARCRPARIRRRWPGRFMPMSTRLASLRPWHSVAHTSPCCSKSAVYCSRCSARSHSATDSAASWPSAMASGCRGPGLGSDLPPRMSFLVPRAPHGALRWKLWQSHPPRLQQLSWASTGLSEPPLAGKKPWRYFL